MASVTKDLIHLEAVGLIKLVQTHPELEYLFRHALIQEAAYNSLLIEDRKQLHRQVGEVLENQYPDQLDELASELVRHYHHAGDVEKERHYAKLAGQQARKQFANDEAVGYFSRALELTPEDDLPERYTLLLAREDLYDLQGAREAQKPDLAALKALAEAMADGRRQAEVALRQAKRYNLIGNYQRGKAKAEEAIKLARQNQAVDLEATGYFYQGWRLANQADYEAARSQLEQALSLAPQMEEVLSQPQAKILRLAKMQSLRVLGYLHLGEGDYGEAKTYFEQSLHLSREVGDWFREGLALSGLGQALTKQGDYTTARAYFEQALSLLHKIGHRYGEANVLNGLGLVRRRQGDFAGAKLYLEQALDLSRQTGYRSTEGEVLTELGDALLGLGDSDRAVAVFQQAVTLRQELGTQRLAIESRAGLARAALTQKDLAQAQTQVEKILSYLESNTLDGTEEPVHIYLTCYRVMQAAQDSRADEILNDAYNFLQGRAAKISDEGIRQSFLQKVETNREIVAEWEKLHKG